MRVKKPFHNYTIEGETCKRGYEYLHQELTDPHRNIASSILLGGGVLPLVSIRLSSPIPREKILDVMEVIKKTHLNAPDSEGQVAISNVLGLKKNVIVTKNVVAK